MGRDPHDDLDEAVALEPAPARAGGPLVQEPPVVARLVIEIRSDGSRTIARGAMEDVQTGQRVAIEAKGDSPFQLAMALAKSLTQIPRLAAKSTIRGLFSRKNKQLK
jgi:hypothetical protein